MLWKEIGAGFLIAGFIALLPMSFFNGLFLTDAPAPVQLIENVLVGPIVAASRSSARSGTSRSPPCCGRAGSRFPA